MCLKKGFNMCFVYVVREGDMTFNFGGKGFKCLANFKRLTILSLYILYVTLV